MISLIYYVLDFHYDKVPSIRYVIAALMIWHLSKKVLLLPPKLGSLQFGDYIKSGTFFLCSLKLCRGS